MNCFIRNSVIIGIVCLGIAALSESRPVFAAGEEQAVLTADAAFLQAIAKGDKAAVGKLLEPEFLWVDTNSNQWNRAQVLQKFPPVENAGVEAKVKMHGDVGVVRADLGKADVMRVWVKRPT